MQRKHNQETRGRDPDPRMRREGRAPPHEPEATRRGDESPPHAQTRPPQEAPEASFDDDVIEIPLYEEILVKKTVVREIVRIRKDVAIEQGLIDTDLRKEDVEIEDDRRTD